MRSASGIFPDVRRILCLGAHSDDIEIGCGGTILRLLKERPDIQIDWHVFSAPGSRRQEARKCAARFLGGASGSRVRVHSFRESYFPVQWAAIKDAFEKLRKDFEPDIVFTHWRDDRHQDHRVLSDLTWNTFRNHSIFEYEIPKYDGDLGNPNFYVALDEGICRQKVTAILKEFKTQSHRHWFTEDAFRALLRLRGIECGSRARYAEAFHSRKLVV